MSDRIQSLEALLEDRPDDSRLRFGLALEYIGAGRLEEAERSLRRYLELAEDEGNAWGRLGGVLRELGRDEEAREAYRTGIQVSLRHGHPSMAQEYEEILEDWA
jgi:Flp pilus assembly protein TadD